MKHENFSITEALLYALITLLLLALLISIFGWF